MIQRSSRSLLALVLAVTAVAGLALVEPAAGQTFGRVKFTVRTPDGEPVQGVKITVSCQELGKFNKELKTNKKGEAILSVVDATKAYQIVVDYEGFPPLESEVRPKIRETIDHNITLDKGAGQQQAVTAPSQEARLTPAQEAFNAGVTAAKEEDYETAKAKFLEAAELDDKLAPAHMALAGLYFESKEYEQAIAHGNRLVELEADNTRGYRLLYEAHSALGNKKEAKEAFEKLSDLGGGAKGDTAAVMYNEGVTALKVGDAATAKANFLKALEVQEDLYIAMQALALVYIQEGSYAEAAAMTERYLEHDPGNQRVLRMRWDAYRGLGDPAKEREAFDALAAADPQVLVTEFFNEGAKQFEAGDTTAARTSFEKVLAIDPEHPRAHYQLALCLIQSGDNAGAKTHFEKFIELAPDDPEAATAKEMLSYVQ